MTELKPIRVVVNGKCPVRCSDSGMSFIWGNYRHKHNKAKVLFWWRIRVTYSRLRKDTTNHEMRILWA